MISPTADLLATGATSTTVGGFPTVCATVPWTPAPSDAGSAIRGAEKYRFFTVELDDFLFALSLDRYFQAAGPKQRTLRRALAATISQSEHSDARIRSVLDGLASSRSQSVIAASIDLLLQVGPRVVPFALRVALTDSVENQDVAFVLGQVGARQAKWLTYIFLKSSNPAVREGALEAVATRAPLESKPVLERVARSDGSASLRARACELIEDLG